MHDEDITAIPYTVGGSDHLTEDDVRAYLVACGYAAEVDAMIADAAKFPDSYRVHRGPAPVRRARPAGRGRVVLAGG
jgi:hypothetical protein